MIIQPGILDSPHYLSDISLDTKIVIQTDLSANENALGPSQKALAAFKNSADYLCRYPDGDFRLLRKAIGENFLIDPEKIVCGAGSDELITLITRIFAGRGDEVLFSEHSFIMYSINAKRVGAKPVKARAKELGTDIKTILDSITNKTRIIFIANPNNPTGTYLGSEELQELAKKIPSNIILVIDSAYAEYIDSNEYEDGRKLVDKYPNVIMLRTFSKIHALASLRLGWCYASVEIIDLLQRSRGPYNVSGPAQMAGIAAIQDEDHVLKSRIHNQNWLDKMVASLQKLQIAIKPSVCNFFLVDFKDEATAMRAYQYFLDNGIKTRPLAMYELGRYLRITIGTANDNENFLNVIKEFTF